jgi:hypothetical protein
VHLTRGSPIGISPRIIETLYKSGRSSKFGSNGLSSTRVVKKDRGRCLSSIRKKRSDKTRAACGLGATRRHQAPACPINSTCTCRHSTREASNRTGRAERGERRQWMVAESHSGPRLEVRHVVNGLSNEPIVSSGAGGPAPAGRRRRACARAPPRSLQRKLRVHVRAGAVSTPALRAKV